MRQTILRKCRGSCNPYTFFIDPHKIRRRKECDLLSAQGQIQVNAYVSNARIPLKDVAVTVTDAGGSAIAMRLTNRSGQLDEPITIEVPDRAASLNPNTGVIPFSTVNLYARHENYEEIFIENLQVFADTVTDQDLELIPLAEYPDSWNKSETFLTPPQNL
ncbi:MAG: hypothetical protein E7461_03595 [Ruminococcaceae bacterium]|nr:hypothetical protein [Oscillospiraceae bacterium]